MKNEALKKALDDLIAEYHMETSSFAKRVDEIFKQALAAQPEPVRKAMPENWFAGMPEEYRKEAWRVATPPAPQPAVPDAIANVCVTEEVKRLVALVRADEREACAKVCDDLHPDWKWRAAESIRARGNT
jgi:hypothetical protein